MWFDGQEVRAVLLFVRDPWATMLRDGRKRWELRPAGGRYDGLRPGTPICVNGRDRYVVQQVRRFPSAAAAAAKLGTHACGFESPAAAQVAWEALYPSAPGVLAMQLASAPRSSR